MRSVSAQDYQTIVNDFNKTDDPTTLQLCLHRLFEQAAEQYTNKVALICGHVTLTFGELNSKANRLARALVQHEIQHGSIVGVVVDRSADLVVVLLAVLKTGATYVPIDPALPAERINQMMDDACPKLLITGNDGLESFSSWKDICMSVERVLSMTTSDSNSSNLGVPVRSDSLAYVMYTSGSTGRPKGVEVSHESMANLLLSMKKEPGCIETDRLLALTTVSFDMAVLELFLPLISGATTIIAQTHQLKDTAAIVDLMERHKISIMQGTPATWQMLLDSGWQGAPRLEKIFCGGEALSRSLADRLLACGDEVWNMYGPTEATVYASIWKVTHDHEVLVGGPITNGRLYVLDADLYPVPLGSPGELYIGGTGVARGYRNNSELTSSRFLENPFHNGQMYRTGDQARLIAPGKLSVSGRIDSQVKIRGHRIELGDVEAAITERDDISGAVVICRDDRLVAYCVRKSQPFDKQVQDKELGRVLRPWLTERLPAYMVPAFFVEMDAFPVTINGKIDRKVLPDPLTKMPLPNQTMLVTELESQLTTIWSTVLGHDRVGINDNFFEVGGDSLRLIRVQRELEMLLGRPVSIPKLFEHYTIKTLAAYLTARNSPNPDTTKHVEEKRHPTYTEDIAIVSMACRLPGGVTTPDEFWELLKRGGDAIIDVPEGRWNDDILHSGSLDKGSDSYCRRGGFIPSIHSFDASFFGISPREARRLDPSQYMMLETCWEGFERAGYTLEQLRGSQTGVFIGTSNILAHLSLNPTAITDLADLDGYTTTGSAGGTMSGRISYQLGLEGPAMTIDTACSSSLVTTHLACNALRQGECDMAVSGGVSLLLNPGLHVEFGRLQGMSPDGRCRSFSADTEGTGWSEGAAVVVLKRLSDAQRDGDTIHAVIRGTAVNHDGRSASLTTPSGSAQQRLIRTALKAARLQPTDIDYIEAHGTGTKLGDPIEATALAEVFGPTRGEVDTLLVGSVKSNIGHTQAAAGLVGLLKVVLSIQHGSLPQTLHVTEPTPAVDWKGANMLPIQSRREWLRDRDRPRRAGVSAFGIGGTNAHIVIQEPPVRIVTVKEEVARRPLSVPFVLSADTDVALRGQATKLRQHILGNTTEEHFDDLAYSLATTRTHFRKRLVVRAEDRTELLDKLDLVTRPTSLELPGSLPSDTPRLAMLFTGQGSQWPGMGRDLAELYPAFREAMAEVAAKFTELERPLLDVMWAQPGSTAAALLDRTDFAQPALFALEVALWRLWQSLGIKPEAVLGHSLGELVAAHIAGVMDLPDACRLVAARSHLMQAQAGNHEMVSLAASAVDVATAIEYLDLGAGVDIALYNTPLQTVISGHKDAVDSIADHFIRQGCKTKVLVRGHAFHSRQMDGMLDDFRSVAETVQFHPPKLCIVSSLDGKPVKNGHLEHADYWVKQVREPVRFSDGIQTLAHQGISIFLEIGPQPVLCGMGIACLPDDDKSQTDTWLSSLKRSEDSALAFQHSVATLHELHLLIDWSAYFSPYDCRRVELPTYAFHRNFVVKHSSAAPRISDRDTISRPSEGSQDHLQFEIVWHPIATENVQLPGTWGFFNPPSESKWANSVVPALLQAGMQFVNVDNFKDAEDLDGLICLWDSDTDVISETQDFTAQALEQLQTAARSQFLSPLVWITRNAIGTGNKSHDEAMRLGAAPLWGLMRTARSEHPELNLRLVDVVEVSSTLIASALVQNNEPECAVIEDHVLVPRMQRISHVPKTLTKQRLVRLDGAVLITGGLGHLGMRVARWLASHHDVRDLVLTSRQGMDTLGSDEFVTELSRLGVSVVVLAGNIADPEFVTSIMATFNANRPLRGIVHAAGVADSGVLSAMTPERCKTTLEPKVFGAWLLHQATRHMDLDLFLLFSSISGVMGMQGLANYAAANSFLDALAHLRRAQGSPATSVAYGTWIGDGMASRLSGSTLSHLHHFGLDPLTTDQGLDLLEQSATSSRALIIAAALDLGRLEAYLQLQGRIPPLLSLLLNQSSTQATSSAWSLSRALSEADSEHHSGIMLNMVREVVAKTLGFTHPLDVDVDRPLKEIGIDSLTAVQMRNYFGTLTGLILSVNIAFIHPTPRALSQSLLSQLRDLDSSSISMSSSSGTSATSVDDPPIPLIDIKAVRRGCLDSTLTFDNAAQRPDGPSTSPASVFLTGATGFVGASILYELLKQGILTYCLVRAEDMNQAQQRVLNILKDYGFWDTSFTPLIKPIVGDMSQPLLGLTLEEFDELADQVDSICHSGALVDWMRPLDDYIGPNVISTHEILRLASHGRAKAIHLVSTISTLPKHMGLDLKEGDQEYGYGTSKYTAERLVAAARWRGANASIYRLPFVTASTTTGHFRLDRGDFLHNLIMGSLEMGAFPSLDADLSAVLPINYLSKTIVAVMTDDAQRQGRDYDFLNTRAPTCNEFFELIGVAAGGKDIVKFGVWKTQALKHAAVYPKSSLARISAVLDGYTDETAANMFKGMSVGGHVFGGDTYPAPLLDEHFVKAYLGRAKADSKEAV